MLMKNFSIESLAINKLNGSHPLVSRYIQYYNGIYPYGKQWTWNFLIHRHISNTRSEEYGIEARDISSSNRNLIENIISFSNEGSICDGDYLEDWVYKALKNRGIKTFGDVRNGKIDELNDKGYKVRMTAVDLTRWKVITIPDDLDFYGIDPDKFEVAKAIRMSTCVPLIFKPVEISKTVEDKTKVYRIVDGGVLDNFPIWLVDKNADSHTIGFKLNKTQKLFSLNVPLNILRALVSATHDTGIPNYVYNPDTVAGINTGKVSSFDFKLEDSDRQYLLGCGSRSAEIFFDKFENKKLNAKKYRNNYIV
jgi:NTE family protein